MTDKGINNYQPLVFSDMNTVYGKLLEIGGRDNALLTVTTVRLKVE